MSQAGTYPQGQRSEASGRMQPDISAHPTPGATHTGEGMTASAQSAQHFAAEKMKEARETLTEYMPQSTKESMKTAVRDTRSFFSRHPYVLPLLMLMSALIGFSLGSMTTGGVWAASSAMSGYSRGSPEYEAHQKLDQILHSLYGRQSYMDKLGLGGMMGHERGKESSWFGGGKSQPSYEGILEKLGITSPSTHKGGTWLGGPSERSTTDEALSYMGDTLRGMKERFTPSTQQQQQGFGSYLSEHLPVGLGGKHEEYHRPQRSFLDKVRGLYSKSEWEKVDEAEQKLREVLQAAAHRGEL